MADQPTTAVAQPDAAQSLALRYGYRELNARHKDIADRVAALVIAYPDILKLNDPKLQQDFIDRVAKSQSGKEISEALDGIGTQGKAALAFLRRNDPTGILSAAKSTADTAGAVGGWVGAAGKGADIALSPLTITSTALGEFYNQAKVILNDMTPEKAKEIGTSYASVMQARAVERSDKGIFATSISSFGSFWAVAKAGLSTIGDLIAQYLPFTAKFMADAFGSNPNRSFVENVNRQFAEADVKTVREEMTKLGQRNGIDYPAMGSYLTEPSTGQNRAGQDIAIKPPGADSPVPTVPSAAKDDKGNPIVAAPDKLEALKDAKAKAGTAATDEAKGIFGGLDTSGKVASATVGTGLAGQVIRGAAEGFVEGYAAGPGTRAAAAAGKENDLAKKIATAEEAGPKTSRWQLTRKTPEQLSAMKNELAELKEEAEKLKQKAAARAADASEFAKKAQAEVKGANLIEKGWNLPRQFGRLVGSIPGAAAEKFTELMSRGAVAAVEVAKDAPSTLSTLGKAAGASVTAPAGFVARSIPWVEPLIIGFDTVAGISTGDAHKVKTNSWAATIIGTGVAGTAALAYVVGAPVTVPLTMAALTVSGAAAAGYKWFADSAHEKELAAKAGSAKPDATPVQTQPQPTPSAPQKSPARDDWKDNSNVKPLTNAETIAGLEAVKEQARMATARGRLGSKPELTALNLGSGFASVNQTTIGALQRPEGTLPASLTNAGILQPVGG
ncbi:MAG: hypothetical protein ACOYNL_02735 [Rickettsiales bacterium]